MTPQTMSTGEPAEAHDSCQPDVPPASAEARTGSDRRDSVVDRRVMQVPVEVERRSGLDRRRGPGRRRSDDRRSAEEGEMTDEQFEFLKAINEYKQVNRRPFPSWTEVLDVIKALGYRQVAQRQNIR